MHPATRCIVSSQLACTPRHALHVLLVSSALACMPVLAPTIRTEFNEGVGPRGRLDLLPVQAGELALQLL